MSSGLNFLLNEVDVTPATLGAWTDVQDTTNVPVGATGVILRLVSTLTTSNQSVAVRKNGSTDTRTPGFVSDRGKHTGAMVGIDADRIFEAYVSSATEKVWLIGYTTDSTDFLTNSVDKTPGSIDTWTDTNVSGDGVPSGAVGVLVQFVNTTSTNYNGGARNNGSTDTFTLGMVPAAYPKNGELYQAIGVDASRIFEANVSNLGVKVWLIGYFMAPISFETNAIPYALTGTGTWTDITVSGGAAPANADGAIWLIFNNASFNTNTGGVRHGSSTDESYAAIGGAYACPGFFTGLTAARVAQGKISALDLDHYVIGYAEPALTQITVTETASLSDTQALLARLSLIQSASLAEALALRNQLSISQSISLSEVLALTARLSLSDLLVLADSASQVVRISTSDSLSMSDLLALLSARLSVTQGLALSDLIQILARMTVEDSSSLSDLVSLLLSLTELDSLSMADQAPAILARLTQTQAIALADVLAIFITQELQDTLSLTEQATVRLSLSLTEALVLSDALSLTVRTSLSESLTLSETLAIASVLRLLDSIALADAVIIAPTLSISDAITLLDSIQLPSITLLVTEALAIVEALRAYVRVSPADLTARIEDIDVIKMTAAVYALFLEVISDCQDNLTEILKKRGIYKI